MAMTRRLQDVDWRGAAWLLERMRPVDWMRPRFRAQLDQLIEQAKKMGNGKSRASDRARCPRRLLAATRSE